jgi:hypothetical protein
MLREEHEPLPGEYHEEYIGMQPLEAPQVRTPDKRVRVLTDFTFYSASTLVPFGLETLEDPDFDAALEGEGLSVPIFQNVGSVPVHQEQGRDEVDWEDDWEDGESSEGNCPPTRIRLTAIWRIWLDFAQLDGWSVLFFDELNITTDLICSDLWVETEYAWYQLAQPSIRYAPTYDIFLRKLRIAQTIIATVKAQPNIFYSQMVREITAFIPEDTRERHLAPFNLEDMENTEIVRRHVLASNN